MGGDPDDAQAVIFEATPLEGLLLVRPTKHADARGFFARLWSADDFAAAGHPFAPSQISASFNHAVHTLRGLHWQADPHGETKLVRATAGRVFDVAVDLRPGSATRHRWFGCVLDAAAHNALLIPPGFAHGFLSLTDGAEVQYAIDSPHTPHAARGARWDDPAFAIAWPAAPLVIATRDRDWPLL
jgi:dTDP-4-dehydrorhamnose 3,5-epimerase